MLGQKYANGTPFRRAIEEGLIIPKRMIQVGIRGTLFKADEIDWAIQQGVHIINMDDFYEMGMNGVIEKIRQVVGKSATYLTFDIDSVDPAFAPATGGLEPGGLTSREAQVLLRGLSGIHFVGADINEVSPPLDSSNITALLACNLMFEQLCLLTKSLNSND
jgi:guanidinopropionase